MLVRRMQEYYSGVLLVQHQHKGYEEHQQRREGYTDLKYAHHEELIITKDSL